MVVEDNRPPIEALPRLVVNDPVQPFKGITVDAADQTAADLHESWFNLDGFVLQVDLSFLHDFTNDINGWLKDCMAVPSGNITIHFSDFAELRERTPVELGFWGKVRSLKEFIELSRYSLEINHPNSDARYFLPLTAEKSVFEVAHELSIPYLQDEGRYVMRDWKWTESGKLEVEAELNHGSDVYDERERQRTIVLPQDESLLSELTITLREKPNTEHAHYDNPKGYFTPEDNVKETMTGPLPDVYSQLENAQPLHPVKNQKGEFSHYTRILADMKDRTGRKIIIPTYQLPGGDFFAIVDGQTIDFT